MKKIKFPAWAVLFTITLVAGLMLAFTNGMTLPVITEQAAQAAENSRAAVLPAAESFELLETAEGAEVDWCYAGVAAAKSSAMWRRPRWAASAARSRSSWVWTKAV